MSSSSPCENKVVYLFHLSLQYFYNQSVLLQPGCYDGDQHLSCFFSILQKIKISTSALPDTLFHGRSRLSSYPPDIRCQKLIANIHKEIHTYKTWPLSLYYLLSLLCEFYFPQKTLEVFYFTASLNPTIDIGQMEGGFVMGLGAFLSEDMHFNRKTGELLNDGTWVNCLAIPPG